MERMEGGNITSLSLSIAKTIKNKLPKIISDFDFFATKEMSF